MLELLETTIVTSQLKGVITCHNTGKLQKI